MVPDDDEVEIDDLNPEDKVPLALCMAAPAGSVVALQCLGQATIGA